MIHREGTSRLLPQLTQTTSEEVAAPQLVLFKDFFSIGSERIIDKYTLKSLRLM